MALSYQGYHGEVNQTESVGQMMWIWLIWLKYDLESKAESTSICAAFMFENAQPQASADARRPFAFRSEPKWLRPVVAHAMCPCTQQAGNAMSKGSDAMLRFLQLLPLPRC